MNHSDLLRLCDFPIGRHKCGISATFKIDGRHYRCPSHAMQDHYHTKERIAPDPTPPAKPSRRKK